MLAEAGPSGSHRALACVAYFGPLVVLPLLVRTKPRFLYYHTRQGLYLFVFFLSAFLATLGLLYLFGDGVLNLRPVFQVLAVLMLLELVAYGLTTLTLAFLSARGRMPMLPFLGDLAGEG